MRLLIVKRPQEIFTSRCEAIQLLAFPLFSHFDHALLSKLLEMRIDVTVRQTQFLSKTIAMGRVRLDLTQNLQLCFRNQTHYNGIADPVKKVIQTELLTGQRNQTIKKTKQP